MFQLITHAPTASVWLWAHRSKIEPRIGGEFAIYWLPESHNEDSTSGCRITALEPGSLLAIDWKGPTKDPLTHVVFSLVGDGDNCDMKVIHSGFRKGDQVTAGTRARSPHRGSPSRSRAR